MAAADTASAIGRVPMTRRVVGAFAMPADTTAATRAASPARAAATATAAQAVTVSRVAAPIAPAAPGIYYPAASLSNHSAGRCAAKRSWTAVRTSCKRGAAAPCAVNTCDSCSTTTEHWGLRLLAEAADHGTGSCGRDNCGRNAVVTQIRCVMTARSALLRCVRLRHALLQLRRTFLHVAAADRRTLTLHSAWRCACIAIALAHALPLPLLLHRQGMTRGCATDTDCCASAATTADSRTSGGRRPRERQRWRAKTGRPIATGNAAASASAVGGNIGATAAASASASRSAHRRLSPPVFECTSSSATSAGNRSRRSRCSTQSRALARAKARSDCWRKCSWLRATCRATAGGVGSMHWRRSNNCRRDDGGNYRCIAECRQCALRSGDSSSRCNVRSFLGRKRNGGGISGASTALTSPRLKRQPPHPTGRSLPSSAASRAVLGDCDGQPACRSQRLHVGRQLLQRHWMCPKA